MTSVRSRRLAGNQAPSAFSSVWRMFGLVFFLSLALTIFILFRQRRWEGNHQRAVLLVHEGQDEVRQALTIVVLKPEKKVQVLPIPSKQVIETPLDYGSFSSDALVGLTQLENLQWEFLTYTLSLEFGVGIDGIIWTKDEQVNQLSQLKKLALMSILNQRPTTMAFWDRLKLGQTLQQVPSYQFELVDVNIYLDEASNRLDKTRYDRWAELYLQDAEIRGSDFSLVVQNATSVNGYATRVGRMLGLMGYYVRGLETVEEDSGTTLYITKGNLVWPGDRLRNFFSALPQKRDDQLPQEKRTNAVLRLGNDQKEWYRR